MCAFVHFLSVNMVQPNGFVRASIQFISPNHFVLFCVILFDFF